MRFSKKEVQDELRGMLINKTTFRSIAESAEIAESHDTTKDFFTIHCAADYALERRS